MTAINDLQKQAESIRQAHVLGRSELMQRLFDYLVNCSLADKAPKEIEVAIEVFARDSAFETTQDAMVRVYIHKLRRKVEEYYLGPGSNEPYRLTIPRGEYRLVLEDVAHSPNKELVEPADATPSITNGEPAIEVLTNPSPTFKWRYVAIAAAALLAVNVLIWFLAVTPRSAAAQELDRVRDTPMWSAIVKDNQPVTIALGDYYIFGELGTPSVENPDLVRRLVRDFGINSRSDLERMIKDHPEFADRYMDVALRYLPVSTAFALSDVLRLLESNKKNPRQVQLVLASDLTPDMIRSTHVVYIGLLSGMGMLRDIAFTGSQFKIGETYDELINRNTNKLYISQATLAATTNARYLDYGYFSTFAGPSGCRIVILAGTRDAALMHTAQAISHEQSLHDLTEHANKSENFEALFAVEGIDQINLDGKLLTVDQLDTTRFWTGDKIAVNITDK
jgi:hypothetical protein